jgi:hypothetical protein
MIACYCGTSANWVADPTRLKLTGTVDLGTGIIPIMMSMCVSLDGTVAVMTMNNTRKWPELCLFGPHTDTLIAGLPLSIPDACALSTAKRIYIAYRMAGDLRLIRAGPEWTRASFTDSSIIAYVDKADTVSMELSTDEKSLFILIHGVKRSRLFSYNAETLARESIVDVIDDNERPWNKRALVTCTGSTVLSRVNGLMFDRNEADKSAPIRMSQGFASLTLSNQCPLGAARDAAGRLYIVENAGLGEHQCLSVYDQSGVCAQLRIDAPLSKPDRCRTYIAGQNRVVALCGTTMLTFSVPTSR